MIAHDIADDTMARPRPITSPTTEETQIQRLVRNLAWLPQVTDTELRSLVGLPTRQSLLALRGSLNAKAMRCTEWALRAFCVSLATSLQAQTPLGTCTLHLFPASRQAIEANTRQYLLQRSAAWAAGAKRMDKTLSEDDLQATSVASLERTITATFALLHRPLAAGEVTCPDLGAAVRDLLLRRGLGYSELSLVTGARPQVLTHLVKGTGRISAYLQDMSAFLGAAGCRLTFQVDTTRYIITRPEIEAVRDAVVAGFADARSHKPVSPQEIDDPDLRAQLRMLQKGWTYRQIGEHFGVSRETIRKRLLPLEARLPQHAQQYAAAGELADMLQITR